VRCAFVCALVRIKAYDVLSVHWHRWQFGAQHFGSGDQALQLHLNLMRFNALAELVTRPMRHDGQMVSNKHGASTPRRAPLFLGVHPLAQAAAPRAGRIATV